MKTLFRKEQLLMKSAVADDDDVCPFCRQEDRDCPGHTIIVKHGEP